MLAGLGAFGAAAVTQNVYLPDDYYRDLTATNADQAQNRFFPAGVRREGEEDGRTLTWDAQPAAYCGRSGCHPAAYQEWLSSAHHHSETDPFYQRVAADYTARSGPKAALWCEGCHAPQKALRAGVGYRVSGVGENPVQEKGERRKEKAQLPNYPTTQLPNYPTPNAQGVDCVTCHATVGTPTRTGNGRFTLAVPQDYPFAAQETGWKRGLHDFLLRVRPGPHQRAYLKPELHRAAEFCSSCHRQSFNVPQNHYQFVRGADEYGSWLSGPMSGRVASPAGLVMLPAQTCQSCHFPRAADGHTSHASLGANTALPALRGDTAHLQRTEDFLRASRVTLDLFALRRPAKPNQPEEWIAPMDSTPFVLRPGETVSLDIVVSNLGVGHSFPAGYEDIQDVWLEARLLDARNRPLLANGVLPSEDAPLPPDTHAYRMVALNRNGDAITQHNLTEMVTTVTRRAIAPGGSDIARYVFTLPQRDSNGKPLPSPLHLTARLRYRHLRPDFGRWALGVQVFRRSGAGRWGFPITTIAETSVSLPLEEKGERRKEKAQSPNHPTTQLPNYPITQRPDAPERFLCYGIGLMAPAEAPDLPRARRAFRQAQELAPNRPEPWLGLGRAYLAEPALLAARTQFETALRLAPGSAAAQAGLGVVLSKQGEYDRALKLLKPLAERFPEDTALQFDFGLALFQTGAYEAAITPFRRALAADPDDTAAHYRLKLCYQHLQRVPEARREEAIGRYLAEDKLAAQLRPPYLRAHPDDARAAQPIPVHTLKGDKVTR